ncbi:NAD(P)/FAD-dependent oxidoreductase [Streptomyces sp. NPDC052052]|uniref:flavin-containing monooxygenase n=1 Tax=Streptomyces sp. NPDC052052 TaxID=3154756 RepID=UPI0034341EF5
MAKTSTAEEFDVLIVGAGISGIGAGRYLRTEHPIKTFAIFEARDASGGTWDLFRYPGIRSDSDLHTFGYAFKPWLERESIADGSAILSYIRETAAENGLDAHIRFRHKVVAASWSSEQARWTVDVEMADAATGKPTAAQVKATWIFCASGYYRYDEGYTPVFPARDQFAGRIVHPQHWPEDLDYAGKRVVIIGSGATAMTMVPVMAGGPGAAGHVTMLQRTPTFVAALPRVDRVGLGLRRLFGDNLGYRLTRRKNIFLGQFFWNYARNKPDKVRAGLRKAQVKALPRGYAVDRHFNPPYNPWDQRLCAVPDGDLFKAISSGSASIATDTIETFTETGIRLTSGEHLDADVIVTATGLNLQFMGGITLAVDGTEIRPVVLVAYRGMMLSGVPNFAFAIGYTNSSWTLKIGLLCEQFCRVLGYMEDHGYDTARAIPDPGMGRRPLLDFGAGYVKRSLADLPSQGDADPWLMSMSYHADRKQMRDGQFPDRFMKFSKATSSARSAGRSKA